jgi:diguanylate cyclase (GGDEF)-like protein
MTKKSFLKMISDYIKIKLIKHPTRETIILLSIVSFVIIPVLGLLDYLTGPNITFSLIYLLPVSAIAWLNARPAILLASILTVSIWMIVDLLTSRFPFNFLNYTWNFSYRFIAFLILATLLSVLKQALLQAEELSHRDPLTNALNSRGFKELAEHEIYRSLRSGHALTIAFLDVDDFKAINDSLGHNAGDVLLATIVESIHLNTRKSDVVGRVGGDEFVILFPDTDQVVARSIVNKIRKILTDITHQHNWPVTLSMGVLTCLKPPPSLDALIGMADKLMYTVKGSTKNNVVFAVYPQDSPNGDHRKPL